MTSPTQTCGICGRVEVVRPDGRGFPPDIAKRRLKKACKAAGCVCQPQYRAGVQLAAALQVERPDPISPDQLDLFSDPEPNPYEEPALHAHDCHYEDEPCSDWCAWEGGRFPEQWKAPR